MSIFNLLREELNKKRGKQQLVSIKDVAREVPRATLNTAKGIGLEILKTPARWGMGVADVPRTLAGKKPLKKVDIKYPTLWGQMDLGSVQSYARETHDRVQGGETPLGASLGVGGKAILDTVAISSLAEKMMPRLSQPINFSKAGPAYGPQRPTVTETAANKKYNDVMDDIQDTLKHKYDDFVKAGQVPRDAVYKTDQFYTRKVAEGKINDIAQKMDIRFPGKGLGDAYRLRSNPSHTNDDIMFKTARDILDNIPTESGIVTYYNTGGVRGEMNTMVNQSLHAPTVGKGQYLSMDKVSNSQFGDVTHRYLLDKNVKVLDLTKGFHESGYSRVVDYQQAQPLFREALMKTNGDVIKLAKSKGFDGVKVLSDDGANVWLALADDIPVKEIFNTQSLYKYLESLAKVPGGIESIQGLGGKGAAAIGTLIAGAGASLAGVMALKGKKKDQKEVQPLPGGEERISQGERRGPLANFFDKYLKEPLSGVDTEFRPENEDFLTGLKNQGLLNVFNFGGITRSIESREFDRQKELIGTGVEPGRAAQLASLDVRTPSSKRDEMFEEFGVTKEEQKALRVARRWETFDSTLGALDFFPILGTLGKRGLQTAVRKIASTADVKRIEALVRSEFPGLSDAATTKLSRELVPIKDADKVNETINDYVQREAVESLRITRQGTDALKKTREILSPTKAPRMSIRARATKITNTLTDRFIAEFAPLTRMESAIYRANNAVPDARITIGRRFEQLAGSAGKGEVDIGMFQREVLDKIKGMEGAFNEFLFLRRTVDRLQNNPELKKVGEFTVDKANEGLRALRDELGQANYKKIRDLAESQYQKVMDDALRLQLTSGRISQKSYDAIKKGNKFYTPFMLTEKGGVDLTRQGAGQVMEKTDPFVRSIVGIDDDFFKIRDPLQRSAELIYRSRVIAEQNRAMLALADLAKVDKTGIIRKVPVATQKAPAGKGIVRYFDNGVEKALEVPVEVAEVITRMNNVQRKIFGQTFLAMAAKPLRWGATAGNLAFQAVNFILADLPTQALLSKHGIKNPVDLVRYPLDVVYAMYSSFMGNVLGKPNKLFEEFLRSGAANSTMQRAFTPEAFRRQVGLPVGNKVTQKTGRVLNTLAGFASTLEDTTKLMALKRGMRLENIPTFDVDAFTKGMKIKGKGGVTGLAKESLKFKSAEEFVKAQTDSVFGLETLTRRNAELAYFDELSDATYSDLKRMATPAKDGSELWYHGYKEKKFLDADVKAGRLIQFGEEGVYLTKDYNYALSYAGENPDLVAEVRVPKQINKRLEVWGDEPFTASFTKGQESLGDIPVKEIKVANIVPPNVVTNRKFKNADEFWADRKNYITESQLEDIWTQANEATLTAAQEKEALSRMYEVVTEVRNWGGSPDFLRRGSETKSLNLLLMFLNARIQGINTGIGTMAGTYGTKRAATAWARVTAGVGLPTLVLMAHNMRPENREDYYKINKTERDNYWMIPQDTYFQDSQGNMVRDYIRIPKRNITQVFSNIIEAGMEFAYEKDPEALLGIGTALVENVSPITMHFDQGVEGFFESLASNVNPAIKVPGEYGTNRNFFYHTDLEPDYIEGVRSKDLPKEERYKDNTHEFYRTLGRISKQSPLKIEHAVRGLTGGFFNQFVGDTPSEGRSALSEAPLFKRFFRSEYMATTDTTESIKGSLEGQAVSSANRNREAKEIMSKMKELAPQDRLTLMSAIKKTDPLLAKRILDKLTEESKGIDFDDRMLRQLNVNNGARAKAIIEIMSGLEPEEKVELFNELARKKIISAKVKEQIFFIIQNKQ